MHLLKMMAIHALFAPDTGDGGGDTSTPADPPIETPADATPEPVAPGKQKLDLDQDGLNAIVKKAKAQARSAALKEARTATPAPTPVEAPADTQSDAMQALTEQVASLMTVVKAGQEKQAGDDFDTAVSGFELSDEQRTNFRQLWDVKAPDADFSKTLESMGATKGEPDLSQKGPGFKSPGGPSPKQTADKDAPPHTLTGDDVASMQADGTFLDYLKGHQAQSRAGGLFKPKNRTG